MFWDKWFQKVGEPVLTMVKIVKENPKKHKLEMLSEHHLMFRYNGNPEWSISISYCPGYLNSSSTADWMNKSEKIYVYKELFPLAKGDRFTRQGWMQRVLEEDGE